MVKACSVKYCKNNTCRLDRIVSFHAFPHSKPEVMKKWLDFLNYGPEWKPTKHGAICSDHFESTDFKLHTNISILKNEAFPSVKTKPNTSEEEKVITNSNDATLLLKTENIDKTKLCRLCCNEYKYKLINIFQPDNKYADKIYKCLRLRISTDDSLPLYICSRCEKNLNNLEKFINTVTRTQEILIYKFRDVNNIPTDCTEESSKNATEEIDYDCKMQKIEDNNYPDRYDVSGERNVTETPVCYKIDIDNDAFYSNYNDQDNALILSHPTSNFTVKENITNFNVDHNINTNKKISGSWNKPLNLISSVVLGQTSDESYLKTPIKLETMTPLVDGTNPCPQTIQTDRPNKKIKILEDIKIDPSLIDYTSFKYMYDESILNINKKNTCQIAPINVNKLTQENKTKTVNEIKEKASNYLVKSSIVCKYCNVKFISKYALNHHVKHVCERNPGHLKQKKSISKKKNVHIKKHSSKCSNTYMELHNKTENKKNRRKSKILVRDEFSL